MNIPDVIILLISITFTISGLYINFSRKKVAKVIEIMSEDSSLKYFRLLIPLALLLSLVLYFTGFGDFNIFSASLLFIGYTFIVTGLLIRWVAVYTLGDYFRVKVSLVKNQQLITKGVYKLVRHPSYTGLLMYYLGLGLIMHNLFALILLISIPFLVVIYRTRIEEKFLTIHFGSQYIAYKKQSYFIIPYIY